jgi:hypothetical protein
VSAAVATDFFGEPAAAAPFPSVRWFRRIGGYALLGILLLAVNVPQYLYRVIDARTFDPGWRSTLKAPIEAVQAILSVLIGGQPDRFFERAMSCGFLLLLVFLLLALVLSARRGDLRMFAYGLGGMIAGYFALHLIAWAAVAVVAAVGALFFLFGWVGSVIAAIVSFVIHYLWLLFVIGAAYACFRHQALLRQAVEWLRAKLQLYWKHLIGGGIVALVLALVLPAFYRWVLLPVWNFIATLLSPVVQAILFVLKWLLVVLLVGILVVVGMLALALVGSLFVTQLQATWHAARNLRLMLVAGFAIGSMVALIALVSVATPALAGSLNQAWENALGVVGIGDGSTRIVTDMFIAVMPSSVESFVTTHLTNQQAPAFDSLVFMAMMVLGSTSVATRILEPRSVPDEAVPLTFVAKEYAIMAGGLFVGVILMLVAAATNSDSA